MFVKVIYNKISVPVFSEPVSRYIWRSSLLTSIWRLVIVSNSETLGRRYYHLTCVLVLLSSTYPRPPSPHYFYILIWIYSKALPSMTNEYNLPMIMNNTASFVRVLSSTASMAQTQCGTPYYLSVSRASQTYSAARSWSGIPISILVQYPEAIYIVDSFLWSIR